MIRLVTENDFNTVFSFCENSATGCRISASLSAYGTDMPFHNTWLFYNEDEVLCGVIAKTYRAVTICYKHSPYPNELKSFLKMQPDISEVVFEQINSENFILKYNGKQIIKSTTDNIKLNNARDIYYVLKKSGDNEIYVNDEMYVDISHRIRHNCLTGMTAYKDEKPISCACAHISENDALITAVETLPDYRNCGFASSLILSLCNNLKDKNIFLMCKSELFDFYKKTGFEKCGGYTIESAVF